MPAQSTEQIEADIIELCSEDDYGSWELWWNVSANVPNSEMAELKGRFQNVISDLVDTKKLIAKRRNVHGDIIATQYDPDELTREIASADDPDPDSYFWFGTA
jgi:hypothetical protein